MGRADAGTFAGFGPRALRFFSGLAFHQSKAWFDQNRALYEEEVRAPMEALVSDLSAAFADAGLPLKGDRRSIFRLHRDTRFAKDKRPYKTNCGAVLTPDGTKRAAGLVYVHVDPQGCFAAAGFWQPEPDQLRAIRQAVVARPAAFRAMVAKLGKAGLDLSDGDRLERLPKGFDAVDAPDLAAAVRRRSFVVRHPLDAVAIRRPDLAAAILSFAREAEPLLRFGWAALRAPGT